MSTRSADDVRVADASAESHRLLRKEALILEVTEAITRAMAEQDVSKAELALRIGRSPAFVTQILSGGRNLTLRTIAEVADALRADARFALVPSPRTSGRQPRKRDSIRGGANPRPRPSAPARPARPNRPSR